MTSFETKEETDEKTNSAESAADVDAQVERFKQQELYINEQKGMIETLRSDMTTLIEALKEDRDTKQAIEELSKGVNKEALGDEKPVNASSGADNANLTQEQLIEKAVKVLESREVGRRKEEEREKNWKEITSALTQIHGNNTNTRVKEVASKHALTMDEMEQLAKDKPALFRGMFKEIQGARPRDPSNYNRPGLNTGAMKEVMPEFNKPFKVGVHKTKDLVEGYLERLERASGALNQQ